MSFKPNPVRMLKVVDIVFIKEKIGYDESVLSFFLDTYDLRNNSFIHYKIGQHKDEEDYSLNKEDAFEYTWKYRELDELLIKNYGLQDGERVLLLVWW